MNAAIDPGSATDLAALRARLTSTLEAQRAAYARDPVPAYRKRVDDLRQLRRFILENREGLIEAVNRDYGNRSRHETQFGELVPVLDGLKQALHQLRGWMRPQRRAVDLLLFPGARNRVLPQPLGVVGMIVPWNFPINLMFLPLISIFAAGNRAMVKLSENSRHLAAFLIANLPRYFPAEKLAVFDETGGVGVEFSRLPFDHLLFTGSTQTGRSVMAAAAANLTPVTLELGGKSPALVCEDFPLRTAAERILFVKLMNAGQICTTVDYLFLPQGKIEAFVALAQQIVSARYPDIASRDYTSIIDARAFARLRAGARGCARPRRARGAARAGGALGRGDAQDRPAPGDRAAARQRADAAGDLRADPAGTRLRAARGRGRLHQRAAAAARLLSLQPPPQHHR